jgi:putative membrane protein
MKSKIARTTAILAGAALMLSAAVLFAMDGIAPFAPPSAQPPNDMEITDPGRFLEAANIINRTEIEMGRLANERGQSASVRKLGKRMVQDHARLENKLKALATSKDIVLSKQVDIKHQNMIDKLAAYSGSTFDRHYVEDQVMDHQKAIALFQQAAAENQDRSVRDYAPNSIPVLQQHLQLAEKDSKIINQPTGASPGQ